MSEEREEERPEERDTASRPTTAAARRERRASARPAAPKDRDGRVTSDEGGTAVTKDKKGVATQARDRREKRGSVFKRLGRFLREVVAELRKVIWPTRKQLVTYTTVVLIFLIFMVALVWGLDAVFAKGMFELFS